MTKNTFVCNGDNMPGSARYYTDDKSKCSDDVRFIGKNKYPQKILMWLVAISNRGMSIPYFRPSKSEAINTEIYFNEYNQDSYHLSTNITGTSTIYFGLI